MPYTLIIADDEEHIREGLNDLVAWDELGFQVVAKLEDGQDILDWIDRHPVDVILTDIKMSSISGLEVAGHIFNNRLSPKIVLISGYREFELAKQAVSCNVVDYLLKPTKLDEITRVFTNVKRKLDEEKDANKQLLRLKQQSDELLLRKQPVDKKDFPSDKSFAVWNESKRKFLAYVNANHFEVLPERFAVLMDQAVSEAVPLKALHHMLDELSSFLRFKLSNLGIPANSLDEDPFGNGAHPANDSLPACKQWWISQLEQIVEQIHSLQLPGQLTLIKNAKTYASRYFDKDISLKVIAEHVYLSPDYFSRLFKQHTGGNFTDFLLELRMNKAMEYLANPQYKVYEIGPLVGYGNAKYFFKMFKKHTGFTPSEYRRKFCMGN